MKRGPRGDELTPPLNGDNMLSAVQRIAGVDLGTPLQVADQTAALHLGHFAMSSALGRHVIGMLDGNGIGTANCNLLFGQHIGQIRHRWLGGPRPVQTPAEANVSAHMAQPTWLPHWRLPLPPSCRRLVAAHPPLQGFFFYIGFI